MLFSGRAPWQLRSGLQTSGRNGKNETGACVPGSPWIQVGGLTPQPSRAPGPLFLNENIEDKSCLRLIQGPAKLVWQPSTPLMLLVLAKIHIVLLRRMFSYFGTPVPPWISHPTKFQNRHPNIHLEPLTVSAKLFVSGRYQGRKTQASEFPLGIHSTHSRHLRKTPSCT